MPSHIHVLPLSPDLLQDYLFFFDGPAFADNPHWASCYCYFHHNPVPDEWDSRTAAQNRGAVSDLILAGRMNGFLAYSAGSPVGWCKASPRLDIPGLALSHELAINDAHQVGSIVCFIVAKEHRHTGIASALLEAACKSFISHGLNIAEAYPRTGAFAEASDYHGPLQMYRAFGFETFRELDKWSIVRKEL